MLLNVLYSEIGPLLSVLNFNVDDLDDFFLTDLRSLASSLAYIMPRHEYTTSKYAVMHLIYMECHCVATGAT